MIRLNLYMGVKCFDELGNPVNVAKAERHDHSVMWYGDAVEILLAPPVHSYYQSAIMLKA